LLTSKIKAGIGDLHALVIFCHFWTAGYYKVMYTASLVKYIEMLEMNFDF